MRVWRKASGLLKDQNSIIWVSSLISRRRSNPEMEIAVIKATSHDEFSIDMKNVDRVYKWLRLSPTHLQSLIRAISLRMDKTRSWVVAIKGLMLMHGIYSSKLPAVQRIGRLPFDLSHFNDGHSDPCKNWAINAFIRSYFTYLDQKSSLLFMNLQETRNSQNNVDQGSYSMIQDLVLLQKLQFLLDMLLEIRPLSDSAVVPLVLEAMDCVMIEIFDVYSRICNGIARVLLNVYSAGKFEACMALKIVRKATMQGEELSLYFELCRSIGVKNAEECPTVEQIPEEDIRELEEIIINGVTPDIKVQDHTNDEKCKLRTIISQKWETFDEDLIDNDASNPFVEASAIHPISNCTNVPCKPQEFPDLISFL